MGAPQPSPPHNDTAPQVIWGSARRDVDEPQNKVTWMGQQRVAKKKDVLHQKVLLGWDGCTSHPTAPQNCSEVLGLL